VFGLTFTVLVKKFLLSVVPLPTSIIPVSIAVVWSDRRHQLAPPVGLSVLPIVKLPSPIVVFSCTNVKSLVKFCAA